MLQYLTQCLAMFFFCTTYINDYYYNMYINLLIYVLHMHSLKLLNKSVSQLSTCFAIS